MSGTAAKTVRATRRAWAWTLASCFVPAIAVAQQAETPAEQPAETAEQAVEEAVEQPAEAAGQPAEAAEQPAEAAGQAAVPEATEEASPPEEAVPPEAIVEAAEAFELVGPGDLEPDTLPEETEEVGAAEEPGEAVEEGATDAALEAETGSLHVAIPGYYQLSLFGLGDMLLNAPSDPEWPRPFGDNLGQNFYGWGRLRATPELRIESVTIKAQFDVMTGILFGDSTTGVDAALEPRVREEQPVAGEEAGGELVGIRPFDFRQLYVEWDTGYGILRAGQQASSWGLGLLANDGDRPQVWGYNRYGDLVERLVFATKPFNTVTETFFKDLVVVLGGDLVYRDHLADLWEGDLAWQGIFALLWRGQPDQAGVYVAYRNQTWDDGDKLEVVAVDATADFTFDLAPSWYLQFAGEGVGVFGSTDVARAITAPEHDVMQFGGALRAAVKFREMFQGQVEVGAATSDANTLDDRLLRFTFDPDYNVGLILFEELLAWQTARAATLAADPDIVAVPPDGLQLLSTNGGVSGALYVNPTLRVRPWEWFDAAVGVLWGYATSDVVSPFEQKVNGVPSNYRGGPSGNRNLGTEIDVAVNFHVPLRLIQLHAGAQFGYLFLGDAFADAAGSTGDDIWLTEGRLALTF